ncbi:hypothetical protein H8E77_02105 [bacterium]|nr:hypothetical protein [bacterium]
MAIVTEKKDSLESVANYIISQLRKEFPNAEYLINGEVYGDEDLYIDIYVDEAELLVLDQLASEMTFRIWEETGYDILAMIAPMECYPIK